MSTADTAAPKGDPVNKGTGGRRRLRFAALLLLAAGFVAACGFIYLGDVWRSKTTMERGLPAPVASRDDLAAVARTRVYFGHQSVGENILGAVPEVYTRAGLEAPPIAEDTTEPGRVGGFIDHSFLGENEHPDFKISEFERVLRGGLAGRIDVAMMKLCYVDFTTGTDVDALFQQYEKTVDGLKRDYPELEIVHATVPLTVDSSVKNRIKIRLGGNDRYGQEENVQRQRYNELIRARYGPGVFDIAALESTSPAGERMRHEFSGHEYYALADQYSSDGAHLNESGATMMANSFLHTIAQHVSSTNAAGDRDGR